MKRVRSSGIPSRANLFRFLMGFFLFFWLLSNPLTAQIDESRTGSWYMYIWEMKTGGGPFGLQGDFQYRNWNLIGDLEQLLLRTGIYFSPVGKDMRVALGYAHIITGSYGESRITRAEHRIYQEALFPHLLSERIQFIHRFRFEQRFFREGLVRTRWRYNLLINVMLNRDRFEKGCIYLSFYNELFINGERNASGRSYSLFDRNRLYGALGYQLSELAKVQIGYMRQNTNEWKKGQLQLSFHHKIR